MKLKKLLSTITLSGTLASSVVGSADADEQVFGYIKGAETLPKGAISAYETFTVRSDKGKGDYTAWDSDTEFEYGFTNKFSGSFAIKGMGIDTKDLSIDGYLPGPKKYAFQLSGIEVGGKYNFLRPAVDPIGLSAHLGISYTTLDPHSGEGKRSISIEQGLDLQKYFMDGQLIVVGNIAIEATHATRDAVSNLPAGFEWTTEPEMELETTFGSGLSYRFAPNWYAGIEGFYQTEFETEVGQERWSFQAGPSIHYGDEGWWATLTWLPQLSGGGEKYPGQTDNLHLIEKTKQEFRVKVGYNF